MKFDPIYIALNLILLAIFFFVGQKVAKSKMYWPYAMLCAFAFAFVQGCRYMRGYDYGEYSWQFLYHNVSTNPVFVLINEFLAAVGFNRYSCFVAYAFVFIMGALYFLRLFRPYARYVFPLFILGFMAIEEYMIRQAFSYSFFFCFLYNLFLLGHADQAKKRSLVVLSSLFAVITVLIHTGNLINIAVFVAVYMLARKPIHFYVSIPIYLCCVYVFPAYFDFAWLNPILNVAATHNERAAMYVAKSSQWFSAYGAEDRYTRNEIVQILEAVGVSSLLYLGYVTIRKKMLHNRAAVTMFNVFFLGISIMSLFRNFELLNRIGQLLNAYWCFVLAFVLYYRSEIMTKTRFLIYLGLGWFLYDFVKYLFFRGEMTMFIWDAPSYVRFF